MKEENFSSNNRDEQVLVTKRFAEFIATVDATVLSPTLIVRLKQYILDYFGVSIAAANGWESTEEIYNAVLALGAIGGSSTAILKGKNLLPQYAGMLNATYGHTMDFDDTYAPGSLHAGVCAISAALAQAELQKSPSDLFMLATAVGYEVICRFGAELGNAAYARGFHNTATAGIFGAVAAIAILKRLSVPVIENALGLALSKAAGSMQYLDNGSWNKRLHPGFAVHDAFVAIALAEAGVIGATRPIEGKYGLLHAYSPRENHDLSKLVADLGTRWDFLETALKPYPACRMTHGLIEMGGEYGRVWKAQDVKKITVSLSAENTIVVGARIPNKLHPSNMVDAQFSAYFQLAHAWIYGSGTGAKFSERLQDEAIHQLSEKIICVIDPEVKAFGSKMQIKFVDGQSELVDIPFPLGEAEHPFSTEQIEAKYFSLVNPVLGEQKSQQLKELIEHLENRSVTELLEMVAKSGESG